MITLEQVKEHILYWKAYYLDAFSNYNKDNISLLYNIDINIEQRATEYYIEILKINNECSHKINSVNDIIIPIDIFKGTSWGISFIETTEYIYYCRNSKFKDSHFWFGIDTNTNTYKKKSSNANWISSVYNELQFAFKENNRITNLSTNTGSQYFQKISKLFKEKFLSEYNNIYTDIFPSIIEKTSKYYIIENVIETENTWINLNKDVLSKYKFDIGYTLDKFFTMQSKHNFEYSLIILLHCEYEYNWMNKHIYNKVSKSFTQDINNCYFYSIYSPTSKKLKLTYFLNGNIFFTKIKFVGFKTNDSLIIYCQNKNDINTIKRDITVIDPYYASKTNFVHLYDI